MNKLNICLVAGTRPEWIRLSLIIKKLDKVCNLKIIHTGQNYDKKLNEIFFEELDIRKPDFVIDSKSETLGGQLAKIFEGVEKALDLFKPDKVLILGDTNTSLCTVLVERLGYSVYHMEAGNRCYDLKVPEEKNRRVIDCVSSFNLPYTPGSRENLVREGYPKQRIFETGNPIWEVMEFYGKQISRSPAIKDFDLQDKEFILVTAHRAENVDVEERLMGILGALDDISKKYRVIFSCHPRTKKRIEAIHDWMPNDNFTITEPLGFFDFVKLESMAKVVISDSGTCQEEACLMRVPTVTIRDSTERPETVECGSNIVSGLKKDDILKCFNVALEMDTLWDMPVGYRVSNVSDRVVNFLLGNQIKG